MARPSQPTSEFDEKVIQISRVSKKTKGGNKIGFSVLMVVGDKKGNVGVGLGKAGDVLSAIKKGVKKAKKKMIKVPLNGTTIPFPITAKKGAGRVMLKPAPKGSGVIAGGPVRAVVEAAGVRDISSKILGSENQASSVYATFEALHQIERIVTLKGISLKSIAETEAEEEKRLEAMQEKHKKRAEGKDQDAKDAKQVKDVKTKDSKKTSKQGAEKKTAKNESKPAPKAEKKTEAKVPSEKPAAKTPAKKETTKKAK